MTDKPQTPPTEPRWPIYVAAAASVIASFGAIISTINVLRASELAAQDRVFERKLEACTEISRLTTAVTSDPTRVTDDRATRGEAIRSINSLLLVFPSSVNESGLALINQLDLIYVSQSNGQQTTSSQYAALMQAAIDLNAACRADVRDTAGLES